MSASASLDLFFVYIVRCSDDSFYVGHTSNVDERVIAHNEGRGAVWTACRRPVILVYQESMSSAEDAVAREWQIKRWTHAKKLALINGDQAKLKALSKRRSH
jgi:predicted GIY-YIG superfamily endonuclease